MSNKCKVKYIGGCIEICKKCSVNSGLNIFTKAVRGKSEDNNKCKWQTIDTAPKDGTSILVYDSILKSSVAISWSKECKEWYLTYSGSLLGELKIVTHWMPLPEPPND